jgi:hypothetical protein
VDSEDLRRYVIWIVVGLFAFAIVSEFTYRRAVVVPKPLEIGQDADVSITLVSTDAKALACASKLDFQGMHCEFQSRTDRWNQPPSSNRPPQLSILAPYKTTDDVTLLVPGLFNQPALLERLAIDPPNFGQEHLRFVANCKLHVESKVPEIDARWQPQGQWSPQKDVWIGTVSGCWLSDG